MTRKVNKKQDYIFPRNKKNFNSVELNIAKMLTTTINNDYETLQLVLFSS